MTYLLVAVVVRMECVVCRHTFIRLGNYKRHLAKDHPEISATEVQLRETTTPKQQQRLQRVNKCHDCNKTFLTPHKLNLHTRIHLTPLGYPCPLCPDRFPTWTRLRLHKEGKHMRGEFSCDKCGKPFKSKLAMNRHNSEHTEIKKSKKVHGCDECKVDKHKQTHENREYCCDTCNSTFKSKNSLTKHRICHSTEKPFACSTCKRSFSRRGDLNVHFRKHTNKRDFKCNLCDKSFLRNSHLESHQKLHTKILTCVKCGIKFNEFSELVQHRVDCAFKPIDKEFELSQLSESDFINRLSPVSCYSDDRLTNQSEEFDTDYQQLSLMSHTANEAVTQALKSVVHTPDIYETTPIFSNHYSFPYQYSTGQFDEYLFHAT